jgi:hypothetical protein
MPFLCHVICYNPAHEGKLMNLTGVVQQLRKERDRAQSEVERLAAALTALGSLDGSVAEDWPPLLCCSARKEGGCLAIEME